MIKVLFTILMFGASLSAAATQVFDIKIEASKDKSVIYSPMLKVTSGSAATFTLDDKNKVKIVADVSADGIVKVKADAMVDGVSQSPSYVAKVGKVMVFTSDDIQLKITVNKG